MCAVLVLINVGPAAAETAQSRFTAWQEIVLLSVIKVRHAAANCGFQIDTAQVDALLASAELGDPDTERQAFSPALSRQVAADADLYLDTKDEACTQAWERYGPDGAPGIRNTLKR